MRIGWRHQLERVRIEVRGLSVQARLVLCRWGLAHVKIERSMMRPNILYLYLSYALNVQVHLNKLERRGKVHFFFQ